MFYHTEWGPPREVKIYVGTYSDSGYAFSLGFQGNIVRQFGPLDCAMLRFFRFFDSCNQFVFVLYLFPFPCVILGEKPGTLLLLYPDFSKIPKILLLLPLLSLVPRPVCSIRVTRGDLELSAIARGVLGEFPDKLDR